MDYTEPLHSSNNKNIYGINVVRLVIDIYGINSKIYNNMENGKKISSQVAFDIIFEKSAGKEDSRKMHLLKLCQSKEKQLERVL